MNLGAEPKKLAILGVLAVGGGYVFYTNVIAGPDTPTAKPAPRASAPAPQLPDAASAAGKKNTFRKKSSRNSQEFRPTLKFAPEERPNYATIDPTLRLDLLAKVQGIDPEGGSRSIFQVTAAPPPPVDKGTQLATKIPVGPKRFGPEPPPPPPGPPPAHVDPPAPPITLKFYGYSTPRPDGTRRAFFLDGDDIFVASEGDLIKKRYRVVQIGVNSVVMEDTQYKNSRQTIILQQEQAT
jgi:hypothetical protein